MRVDRPDAIAATPEALKPKAKSAIADEASPGAFEAALNEARGKNAASGEFDALHREVARIADSVGLRRSPGFLLDGAHASLDSLDKSSLSVIGPYTNGIGSIDTISNPAPGGPVKRPAGLKVGPNRPANGD
ncbi:MAG: hypothetical protein KC466_14735 [Myxococcales bacterium]|nr:hypothetical protein [Myxococcales bacterium]